MKIKFFFLMISLLIGSQSYAQVSEYGDAALGEPIVEAAIVAGLGATGAILGLSTLSFVSKPEDNLNNIVVGGALGIIIGVGIVAYRQAHKSQVYFSLINRVKRLKLINNNTDKRFSTYLRQKWHIDNYTSLINSMAINKSPLKVKFNIYNF